MHGGYFLVVFVFLVFIYLSIYLVGWLVGWLGPERLVWVWYWGVVWYGMVWYGMGKCIAGFVVFILFIYQSLV
ncbi:hypothetical protein HOY80DRAFT_16956 [Tuber brumale]|nr:hypothetical protein HOY80DRAFT_16956 [Tuber brumale]